MLKSKQNTDMTSFKGLTMLFQEPPPLTDPCISAPPKVYTTSLVVISCFLVSDQFLLAAPLPSEGQRSNSDFKLLTFITHFLNSLFPSEAFGKEKRP